MPTTELINVHTHGAKRATDHPGRVIDDLSENKRSILDDARDRQNIIQQSRRATETRSTAHRRSFTPRRSLVRSQCRHTFPRSEARLRVGDLAFLIICGRFVGETYRQRAAAQDRRPARVTPRGGSGWPALGRRSGGRSERMATGTWPSLASS